ncbi:unnamed protein product [Oppiella nova]|uniref:Sphingolipid delta4-desaturase N-terminal domain-containing protein n=1 Tax=Oppiella nova TaxID=334625 RepID=A0A7R9LX53_9ACAR|nr:unnamed protein product [Oppiella nova]CAG2167168.1 unnamed protein product [Oppiella nova]
MGTTRDFEWVYTDEPHATRRALILAKYPQIKQLMIPDPSIKWSAIGMVVIQLVSFYMFKDVTSFWQLFLMAYCFGGVLNISLQTAVKYFSKPFTKFLWMILQPLFYALRPVLSQPKFVVNPNSLELSNIFIQITFNYMVGVWCGWHIVAYMIGSTILGMGLHPMSGHILSEHFVMFDERINMFENINKKDVQRDEYLKLIPETYSYYGSLNFIMYNLGYHVEHHDFPSIPGSLLPKVREIAPEYYNSLPYHSSWTYVVWKFLIDPKLGPFSRVKRPHHFEWVYTDEPHGTRRSLILAKYPQIKQLMRTDPNIKWTASVTAIIQLISFYMLRDVTSFWQLFLMAYCFGGVLNISLQTAVHEIIHNHAFGPSKPMATKVLALITNLPIGIPIAGSHKKYHLLHHRYQGDDILDTDIPSYFEVKYFSKPFTKFLWMILQPLFYALRPVLSQPKFVVNPDSLELSNIFIQITFNYMVGVCWGWHIVAYMIGSMILGMGLHPMSGHILSEHFVMFDERINLFENINKKDVQRDEYLKLIPETYSYYGPLNLIMYNLGYHVEHHDFPSIPGSLLPKVREIAPEYYNSLPYHSSWTYVVWKFLIDPKLGPFSRVKRPHLREIAPEYYNSLPYHSSWTYVVWKFLIDPKLGPFSRVKRPHRFGKQDEKTIDYINEINSELNNNTYNFNF